MDEKWINTNAELNQNWTKTEPNFEIKPDQIWTKTQAKLDKNWTITGTALESKLHQTGLM